MAHHKARTRQTLTISKSNGKSNIDVGGLSFCPKICSSSEVGVLLKSLGHCALKGDFPFFVEAVRQNLAPKSSQSPRVPKHLISLLYILLVPETSWIINSSILNISTQLTFGLCRWTNTERRSACPRDLFLATQPECLEITYPASPQFLPQDSHQLHTSEWDIGPNVADSEAPWGQICLVL